VPVGTIASFVSHRDFGGRSLTPSRATLGPTTTQCLINNIDQFFIFQNLVGFPHPRFPAIVNAVADESFTELALVVLSFDHAETPD